MTHKLPTKTIDDRGTVEWRLNGKIHREDGPAIEYASGTKEWWLNGRCIKYVSGAK